MAELSEGQQRLVYSLLKPAVRAAARFHVPMRTLAELLRLAYYEHLHNQGLNQREIGERFGQTQRHMRSLAARLRSDFFAAEQQVGLVRELENLVAARLPRPEALAAALPGATAEEIEHALSVLEREGRVERTADGRLQVPARYHVLSSEAFHHRVDALNHFLDGTYRAVLHRMVFDERDETMIKTISFTALPDSLRAFAARFEGALRRDIAELEEEAEFSGKTDTRYTLGINLSPIED